MTSTANKLIAAKIGEEYLRSRSKFFENEFAARRSRFQTRMNFFKLSALMGENRSVSIVVRISGIEDDSLFSPKGECCRCTPELDASAVHRLHSLYLVQCHRKTFEQKSLEPILMALRNWGDVNIHRFAGRDGVVPEALGTRKANKLEQCA